ncbi:MAG: hypothetical protein LC800_18725 [Acidobacteria bacterium]|nr:hypothetical protein [Acidobacteriota bacterium]
MIFDWQTIAVALIVLAALAYALRRGWARVGSMRAGASSPVTPACGNCPGGDGKAAPAPRPNVIVQIGRARTPRD